MKTYSIQHEILLVTNTTFLKREYCEISSPESHHNKSHADRLEEACWNHLLDEILPEVFEESLPGKKLYLWRIRQDKAFLEIELGNEPHSIEGQFSINPYLFLYTGCAN